MTDARIYPGENDYKWREIDLTAARTNAKIFDEGISLTVVRVGTGTWSIKFNSVENDSIDSICNCGNIITSCGYYRI